MVEGGAAPARRRKGRGSLSARLLRSPAATGATAALVATGLKLVAATTRIEFRPRPSEAIFADLAPAIVTAWHGQAFMLPFVKPGGYAVDVLASRHADGELIARTLTRLGCGVIRGSGAPNAAQMHQKGAVAGFRGMLSALEAGRSVALTADFLKNARRKVGPGVVTLAKLSGRPIVPVAFVSSRRREIGSSWDRTTISLPFGRAVCVIGEPVWVSAAADEAVLAESQRTVEARLNVATDEATAIADGRR